MQFNPRALWGHLPFPTDQQYAMRNPVDPNVIVNRSLPLPPDRNTFHPNDIAPLLEMLKKLGAMGGA